MGEFGHTGIVGAGFCIDSWGAGPFVIDAAGKQYRFEDSDRFGPSTLRKDGEIAVRQPGEKSPFWQAHFAWLRQGRRTAENGVTCIYEPLRPTTYYLIGRQMFLVEEGDENGGHQEVPRPSPERDTPEGTEK